MKGGKMVRDIIYGDTGGRIVSLRSILTEREYRVLRLRYVDGLTQAEVGATIGAGQQMVATIIRTSLSKAKSYGNLLLSLDDA